MKNYIVIFFFAALIGAGCSKNAMPADAASYEKMIGAKDYVFLAETANPAGGTAIRLSYGYDLVIKPNEVIATLPYFGRAYTADRNLGGMRFTSKQYKYTASPGKEGSWEIVIEPQDAQDIQEIRLNISPDGYATLHITSTNRQPISYYGRLQEK